tara:strand:- start:359 stop:523 length:165 start_codon:yes stop_codon:yes gene_type:complete
LYALSDQTPKISWKRIGRFSKWALILFILFEISQMIIGAYIGIKIALSASGITF